MLRLCGCFFLLWSKSSILLVYAMMPWRPMGYWKTSYAYRGLWATVGAESVETESLSSSDAPNSCGARSQSKRLFDICIYFDIFQNMNTNYNLSPCVCQKNTVNVFDAEVTRDRYMTWTMTFRQCHDISRSRRLMTVSLWKLLCLNLWQSYALIHGNPVLFRSSKWKISQNVGVLLDKHKEAAHHISWSPAAKPRPQSCQKVAVKVRAKLQKPCEGSSLQINQCIVAPGCAPRERCAAGQGAEVPTWRNIPRLHKELAMVRSE